MDWKPVLAAGVDYNVKLTHHLIDKLDESKLDWKPSAENNWMTTGQLLAHLGKGCGQGFKGFVNGDWGFPEGVDPSDVKPEDMLPPAEAMPAVSSLDEARLLLDEDQKLAHEILGQVSDEDLETKLAPAPWDPAPMPLGARLQQMVLHMMQHRVQLFYYLKLQGVPVNTIDLWGK